MPAGRTAFYHLIMLSNTYLLILKSLPLSFTPLSFAMGPLLKTAKRGHRSKNVKASLLEGSALPPPEPKAPNRFPTPSDLLKDPNTQYEPFKVVEMMIPEGGKHLKFAEGRDRYLPQVYELKSHILVPPEIKDSVQRILLILWPGGDRAYARFFFHHVKDNLGVPRGPNSKMDALGKSFAWIKISDCLLIYI